MEAADAASSIEQTTADDASVSSVATTLARPSTPPPPVVPGSLKGSLVGTMVAHCSTDARLDRTLFDRRAVERGYASTKAMAKAKAARLANTERRKKAAFEQATLTPAEVYRRHVENVERLRHEAARHLAELEQRRLAERVRDATLERTQALRQRAAGDTEAMWVLYRERAHVQALETLAARGDDGEIQAAGIAALACMAGGAPRHAWDIYTSGCVPVILDALRVHSRDGSVVVACLEACCALCARVGAFHRDCPSNGVLKVAAVHYDNADGKYPLPPVGPALYDPHCVASQRCQTCHASRPPTNPRSSQSAGSRSASSSSPNSTKPIPRWPPKSSRAC